VLRVHRSLALPGPDLVIQLIKNPALSKRPDFFIRLNKKAGLFCYPAFPRPDFYLLTTNSI